MCCNRQPGARLASDLCDNPARQTDPTRRLYKIKFSRKHDAMKRREGEREGISEVSEGGMDGQSTEVRDSQGGVTLVTLCEWPC